MLDKVLYFLLLTTLFTIIHSDPIPIKLDSSRGNKGNLEFALQLPNNEIVQIDLNFQLLTVTIPSNDSLNFNNSKEIVSSDSLTTTSTTAIPTTQGPETKYVTIQEAIEAFRQELIKKEQEIAGIIESDHPFYRHFKLQFQDDITLSIRCTYDSNYQRKTLNISCYEYREYERERILSNGEVELIRYQDIEYQSNIDIIDARNVKQLYTMDIS